MANFKKRIKAIESRVAALIVGCLPNLPRPWEEMSDKEKDEFINQFI